MITAQHRKILRHSLGLDRQTDSYRNHFVTGPGSSDYPLCQELVEAGMMKCREGNELTGGDNVYWATDEGIAVAREGLK